jgi:hypothetical protein
VDVSTEDRGERKASGVATRRNLIAPEPKILVPKKNSSFQRFRHGYSYGQEIKDKCMKDAMEIKLKEEANPSPGLWERLRLWLNGNEDRSSPVSKTETNTDVLLSKNQRNSLQSAVESPLERSSDTGFVRCRIAKGGDSPIV